MRFKSGIAAFVTTTSVIAAALCCGIFAYAQNGEKTSNNTKNDPAAGKKPAPASAPSVPADRAKPPANAEKKKDDNSKPGSVKEDGAKATAVDPVESADEKSIRSSADSFTKLYNAHDSKGLAELFAPKAEMIDGDEQVVNGREAIEQVFAEVFKANPDSAMQLEIGSIRVLTPSLAIEEGTSQSQMSPDDPIDESTYVAIHVKVDGKWLLGCVRDWDVPPVELTPQDHLQRLSWLVGELIEESSTSVVHTVCQWHDNDNFLMQEFQVQLEGQIAMSGTMRIGWDAVRKQFKSWIFDSHGGHAEGLWLQNDDEWVVKLQGATAKGESASSTNVYRQIDEDTLGFRSYDRVIDGERQDDIDEIVIKRRPPAPAE